MCGLCARALRALAAVRSMAAAVQGTPCRFWVCAVRLPVFPCCAACLHQAATMLRAMSYFTSHAVPVAPLHATPQAAAAAEAEAQRQAEAEEQERAEEQRAQEEQEQERAQAKAEAAEAKAAKAAEAKAEAEAKGAGPEAGKVGGAGRACTWARVRGACCAVGARGAGQVQAVQGTRASQRLGHVTHMWRCAPTGGASGGRGQGRCCTR